jgi:hypothetical protein
VGEAEGAVGLVVEVVDGADTRLKLPERLDLRKGDWQLHAETAVFAEPWRARRKPLSDPLQLGQVSSSGSSIVSIREQPVVD